MAKGRRPFYATLLDYRGRSSRHLPQLHTWCAKLTLSIDIDFK